LQNIDQNTIHQPATINQQPETRNQKPAQKQVFQAEGKQTVNKNPPIFMLILLSLKVTTPHLSRGGAGKPRV
jgi:hypothetical protein